MPAGPAYWAAGQSRVQGHFPWLIRTHGRRLFGETLTVAALRMFAPLEDPAPSGRSIMIDPYRREQIAYTLAKLAEAIGDSNRDAARLLRKLKREIFADEASALPHDKPRAQNVKPR